MNAFFVFNKDSNSDVIVIPDAGCSVPVDPARFEAFISPCPDFAAWTGDTCLNRRPEDFGTIVATRQDDGDVHIVNDSLWRLRMDVYMTGGPA